MVKNILRLLLLFLAVSLAGILSQLWATEGVEKKVILHDSSVPPPPASRDTVPFDLGPQGCDMARGCARSYTPFGGLVPGPSEEDQEKEKQEKEKQEAISRINTEKEKTIKGHREAISNYERMKREGTSTISDEELDRYINKHKEAIKRAEKDAEAKISQVNAGKIPPEYKPVEPPSVQEPAPAPEPAVPPKVEKAPETKKPEKPKEKVEKKPETAREKELREWFEKEKRNPLPPPDQDPQLKGAVDAIANDTAIHVATQAVNGQVPMPSTVGSLIQAAGEPEVKVTSAAKDMVTYGPFAGAVITVGKAVVGKGVSTIHKDVSGGYADLQQSTIDNLYRDYKNNETIAAGSYSSAINFARKHGCPPGKEQQWLSAYFAARKLQEERLSKEVNSNYNSYQMNMQREFSAFAKDSKDRYQQNRQKLLNAARIYR